LGFEPKPTAWQFSRLPLISWPHACMKVSLLYKIFQKVWPTLWHFKSILISKYYIMIKIIFRKKSCSLHFMFVLTENKLMRSTPEKPILRWLARFYIWFGRVWLLLGIEVREIINQRIKMMLYSNYCSWTLHNKNVRVVSISHAYIELTRIHVAGAVRSKVYVFYSPSLLSVLDLISPRYPSPGTEFLPIDFHRTNYGNHEPISSAIRQFNEVIGPFDCSQTRDQFLNCLRLTLY
jgi:hypothetical protein